MFHTQKDNNSANIMSSDRKTGFPAEAMASFAKSMGIDLNDLEPEAQEIWKMLGDMSKSDDPIQHETFIRQQYENAQNGEDDKTIIWFRPTVGFCVKAQTKEGDGIKVREVTSGSVTGKTLFINICGTKCVDAPVDKAGNVMSADRLSADGLSIPLMIGPTRDIEKGTNLAIDVIVNTIVVDVALKPDPLKQSFFKKQITDLALDWVTKESEVKLVSSEWEDEASPYRGGIGTNAASAVRFFIDENEDGTCNGKKGVDQKSGTLLNPDSLLSSLKQKQQEEEEEDINSSDSFIKINNAVPFKPATTPAEAQASPATAPKKSLIQEVNADGSLSATNLSTPPVVVAAAAPAPIVTPSIPANSLPSQNEYKQMEQLMEQLDSDFISTTSQQAAVMAQNEELSRSVLGDLGKVLSGKSGTSDVKVQATAPASIVNKSDEAILSSSEVGSEVPLSAAAKLLLPSTTPLQIINRSVEGTFVNIKTEFFPVADDKFSWKLRLTVEGLVSDVEIPIDAINVQIATDEIALSIPNVYIAGQVPVSAQGSVSYVGVKWSRAMTLTGYIFDYATNEDVVVVAREKLGKLQMIVKCRHSKQ